MVHALHRCGFAASYIVCEPEGIMVVDVGSIGTARQVMGYIKEEMQKSLETVRFIVATHFHIDHIGGIGHLLQNCGEATKVLFHHIVEQYLKGTQLPPLMKNWFTGLLPVISRTAGGCRFLSHLAVESVAGIPLPLLRRFTSLTYGEDRMVFTAEKRASLPFGDWEVMETPGHTRDSLSLYSPRSRALICGDLILNVFDDGHGILNGFHEHSGVISETYEQLRKTITALVVYPGHGEVLIGEDNVLEGIRVLQTTY